MNCEIGDFGAHGNGRTLNTAAIQEAIDACHRAGGGTVVCGPGRFLTGSLRLRSNVELSLAPGCVIVGSPDPADYVPFTAPGFKSEMPGNTEHKAYALISASEAENVSITGQGEINGSGPAFYDTTCTSLGGRFYPMPKHMRPFLMMFYRCRNVKLADASFVDPAFWTCWLMQCERVNIHRIRMDADQRMINSDGIDVDSCSDVTISDSTFRNGDDCLVLRAIDDYYDRPKPCERVVVTNCQLNSWCQGVRVGCPSDGVIRNCTFNNLTIDCEGYGITFEFPKRYLVKDGKAMADIHDILFSNAVINCTIWPIRIVVEEGVALRRLSDLSFSHLRIRAGGRCAVEGNSLTTIRNVTFDNVVIESTGANSLVLKCCEGVRLNNVDVTCLPAAGSDGGKARGSGTQA